MRPIQLKIKGLHSFREMVTIDFDRLCQGGVFGIFGPTGSGKSTILDAITLSLFGKVERAVNNTQGIINQRETELFVSYTFELMKGSGVRRFRVERTYKGEKESVRNKTSRLIELLPTEQVIADKERDVTRQVEMLLGLTVEDFTRAVVLPQGKFSEFLSLKGKDRREMLERLFHLNEYGEVLNERLKRKLEDTSLSLERITGMQLALGDASEARLAEAKLKEEAAIARFETARSRRIAVEKRVQEEEKLWNEQKELDAVLANQRVHLARKGEIEKQAESLRKGEEAERLYPLLLKVRQGEAEALRYKALAAETKGHLERAKVEYAETKQAAEMARNERDRLLPLLTLQIDRLQEGKAALVRIAERRRELKKDYADLESVGMVKRNKEKERAEKEALLERAREKQRRLVEEMAKVRITAEERENWRRILEAYREIEMLLPEGRRIGEEKEEASRRLEEVRKEIMASGGRIAERMEAGGRDLRGWLSGREAFSDLQRRNDALLQEMAWEAERADVSMEAERRLSYASELSKSLREGEPCPVCGSTHHVHPAKANSFVEEEGEGLGWAGIRSRLDEGRKAGEKLRDRLREGLYHWEEIGRQLQAMLLSGDSVKDLLSTAAHGELSSVLGDPSDLLSAELEAAAATVISYFQAGGGSSAASAISSYDLGFPIGEKGEAPLTVRPYDSIKEAKERLEELFASLDRLQEEIARNTAEGREEIEGWRRNLQHLEKERNSLTALLPLLEERKDSLRALEKREEEHLMRLKAKKEAFAAAYPDIPYEDVKKLEEVFIEREKKEEELKERIDKSVQFIEEKETEQNGIGKEVEGLERQLAELTTAVQLKEERVQEEEERLTHQLISYGEESLPFRGQTEEREEGRGGQLGDRSADRALPILDPQGKVSESLVDAALQKAIEKRAKLEKEASRRQAAYEEAEKRYRGLEEKATALSSSLQYAENNAGALRLEWEKGLAASSFQAPSEVEASHLTREEMEARRKAIEEYNDRGKALEREIERLTALIQGRRITEEMWRALLQEKEEALKEDDEAAEQKARAVRDREELERKAADWESLEVERKKWAKERELLQSLQSLLKGNLFVEFIAEEHLHQISKEASARLLFLTRNRYALELDSTGGFVIRDDMNGGERRPVHSLSGGETFLTSLALALALSSQIQLKGEYPLQFFFLDEGFGTLDPALLDLALTALERIHEQSLSIGIISHVPELKERIMKRLLVEPADFTGRGSRIRIEVE